ncbi:MAG TPA: hypothetical protein VJM12_17165 [Pyrinomonadaceae bacterium]|nr:hypothetical protein [Pyrinomonadaceae bacterium]
MCQSRGLTFILIILLCTSYSAQTLTIKPSYIPFKEAQPILEAVNEVLPSGLKDKGIEELSRSWPSWIAQHDLEIRSRLRQGDEDSLINFLLFGTSFTKQPRLSGKQLLLIQQRIKSNTSAPTEDIIKLDSILQGRIQDLIQGLSVPRDNERLLFAHDLVVKQKSLNPATKDGRDRIKKYLYSSLERVLTEQVSYQKALERAQLLTNASEQFYERSRLYSNRGLSLDTSLLPNFALEEALKAMKTQGLLKEGAIRRVAIIGPGLDFTDKQEGYDFYPQQSIQPFAIIDSLLRLNLAEPGTLQIETFDLSPRVNDHLVRAKKNADRGQSYTLQLPRNEQAQWKPEAIRYWERFGDQIAVAAQPAPFPTVVRGLNVRAVRIRPAVVAGITARDLNIVTQRLQLEGNELFDLIIGTNIFVYYDTFEQSLALANVESMLKPSGFLLSNNALLELPSSRLSSVDYVTLVYSDRPDDGDHIIWYQRRVP